jgi:LemA protein
MAFLTGNILWILLILIVLAVIFIYNGLIRVRTRVKEAWSDIEVQLKRRYDLIPNLVNTVKGYMGHEQKVFNDVTTARSKALGATGKEAKAGAEDSLSGTLKTLFAVAENYPELKANQNFLELQKELSDTENKIQAARRFYNGIVMDLNTRVQTFPTNILARLFSFKQEEFFGTESEEERSPVEVKF